MARIIFPAGNAGVTRLVKRLSKEQGQRFKELGEWCNRWGRIVAFEADGAVYESALAQIEQRQDNRGEPIRQEMERQRLERERRQEELKRPRAGEYPRLNVSLPQNCFIYGGWEKAGLGLLSASQWRRLGYRVKTGTPGHYLLAGRGGWVVPLYGAYDTTEIRSRFRELSGEELWRIYQERGLSAPHAVWATNKLVKLLDGRFDRAHARQFYGLKDRFLMAHQGRLDEGLFVRTEPRGGDGISPKTLYEHRLNFDGKIYSFHSYRTPLKLSEARGADLKTYGKRFGPRDVVPFRFAEYIRMLEHLSATWVTS